MYMKGTKEFEHHVKNLRPPQTNCGYKDFIPMSKPKNSDAGDWADLFQRSGAKYVVPVAEHHDGFPMYDTKLSRWNAAKMGPKRDVVGELAKAVRKRDMNLRPLPTIAAEQLVVHERRPRIRFRRER